MNRTAKSLYLLPGLFLALTGCASMAPEYTQPAAPVPAEWPSGPACGEETDTSSGQAAAATPWQQFFADARLQKLITLALENNRDLRVAILNIERTRAQYRIQRAELLPAVDAIGGASYQRVPDDLASSGKARTEEQYLVELGISGYELDFFGRVRSLEDQALARYLASEEAQRSAQLSLVAEVAAAWLNLAADRERLQLSRETLDSNKATFELTRRRFEAGVASELDLRQAQTSVEASRGEVARATRLQAVDENNLRLLVGADLPAELLAAPTLSSIGLLPELATGQPSTVLLQRPDILQAENLLKGSNANIGAARAAFFPRIVLSGVGGFASDELTGLFQDGSLAWNFIPRVTLPIFDAGRNQANLEVAETDRAIALAGYEKAIQTAFREVADALAQRGTIEEELNAQQALVEATAQTHRLAEARFAKGIDSFLNVLDAQRSFSSAQQNLINVRLARLTSQVTLYKVLGGGAMVGEGPPPSP